MEGISEFIVFWLMYFVFATLAFWCWRRLFFWMDASGEARRFCNMTGAVLLYTPAPIEAGSQYFAPAFVVFPFTLLTSSLAQAMYAANWLLSGLAAGALLLAIFQLVRRFTADETKTAS